jgi:hypothetical protein
VVWVALPAIVPAVAIPWRGSTSLAVGLGTIVVVACVAALKGRTIGLLAGLSGAASFDLLAAHPYGSFSITQRDDLLAVATMSVIGLLVGHLSEQAARERELRAATQIELSELHLLLELAAAGESPGRLIIVAERALNLATGRPCRYESIPFLDNLPELRHNSLSVPAGERGLLATPNLVQLPVRTDGKLVGRFVVSLEDSSRPTAALSQAWRDRAIAVTDQLGRALGQSSR